jgi:CheY-like chemotaxis protein
VCCVFSRFPALAPVAPRAHTVHKVIMETRIWAENSSQVLISRATKVPHIPEPFSETREALPKRKTILLVEDEDQLRKFLVAVLSARGYVVIPASDGQEAMEKAMAFDGLIHLLLSDLDMPRVSGFELAARFRAERPRTKIILMSGCHSSGRDDCEFLEKPFAVGTLLASIASMLKTDADAVS